MLGSLVLVGRDVVIADVDDGDGVNSRTVVVVVEEVSISGGSVGGREKARPGRVRNACKAERGLVSKFAIKSVVSFTVLLLVLLLRRSVVAGLFALAAGTDFGDFDACPLGAISAP